jgi:hypothetical protein
MIALIIFLIIVGALLYIVNLLPIDATIKKIIYIIVIVVIAIYALQMLPAYLPGMRFPR